MATEKPLPSAKPAGDDESRIQAALKERESNLKEQIKRTDALPDTDQHKAQNLIVLKQHLSDLQKDLK